MPGPGFIHLNVRSSYSLLHGAITIGKLAELAKKDHQPALALTDNDNMFGALEFSDKVAGYGIQPIVGCALAVDFGDQESGSRSILTAAGAAHPAGGARGGLPQPDAAELARVSRDADAPGAAHQAFLARGRDRRPDCADRRTGGPDFAGDHQRSGGVAAARCERLTALFGDRLYIELQRHGLEIERRAEGALIDLAYAKGLPLVATNEPLFATADDYEAHDALVCIAGGRLIAETDRPHFTPDHRFKTRAEMAVLFADIPEALASTVEIAQRCSYRPLTRKPILPRFTVGATTSATRSRDGGGGGAAPPGGGGACGRVLRPPAARQASPRSSIASGSPSSSA